MMKESISKLLALAAVVGVVGLAPVQADDEETPLGKEMEAMSGALKSLRRSMRAEDWAACAKAMAEGQAAVIKTMSLVPSEVAAIKDPAEKAKALADVRRLNGLSLAGFAEAELAFLAGDAEAAEVAIDKLKELKKEGHEKYYKDE